MKVYHSHCPCHKCKYREVGCHSNCKNPIMTYEEWSKDCVEKPSEVFLPNKKTKDARRRKCIDREMGRRV